MDRLPRNARRARIVDDNEMAVDVACQQLADARRQNELSELLAEIGQPDASWLATILFSRVSSCPFGTITVSLRIVAFSPAVSNEAVNITSSSSADRHSPA